jgi:hypothetical protein
MPTQNQLAILRVSPRHFMDLFREGARAIQPVQNLLPEDATFVRAWYDQSADVMMLVCRSERFDAVPAGWIIPVLPDILVQYADENSTCQSTS